MMFLKYIFYCESNTLRYMNEPWNNHISSLAETIFFSFLGSKRWIHSWSCWAVFISEAKGNASCDDFSVRLLQNYLSVINIYNFFFLISTLEMLRGLIVMPLLLVRGILEIFLILDQFQWFIRSRFLLLS